MNNINSIRRESLGNKSPYEATTDKSILRLMELMGLRKIPADEVNLTPALLKKIINFADSDRNMLHKAGCVHFDKTRFQSVCFAMPKRQWNILIFGFFVVFIPLKADELGLFGFLKCIAYIYPIFTLSFKRYRSN